MNDGLFPSPRTPASPLDRAALLDGDVLAETVRAALRSDSITAALAIEVEVWDRVVHLRGVVATSSEQHAAEIVAARVNGVGLVANDLELP
jgi:osmotically-inducible protein OsmY